MKCGNIHRCPKCGREWLGKSFAAFRCNDICGLSHMIENGDTHTCFYTKVANYYVTWNIVLDTTYINDYTGGRTMIVIPGHLPFDRLEEKIQKLLLLA